MRRPRFYRLLDQKEHALIWEVFRDSLPSSKTIGIGDGLGFGDRPWTDWGMGVDSQLPDLQYQINVGDYYGSDMSSKTWTPYDGDTSDLLVHEMVHVWQYWNGFSVKISSMWANTFGAGYSFTPGDPWDDYNAEQQATIVEKWHKRGRKKDDILYPYITEVLWSRGDESRRKMTLQELKNTLYHPSPAPPSPIPRIFTGLDVDAILLPILEKRYAANDVAGFGARVRKLEEIFRKLDQLQVMRLQPRLVARKPGDKVSMSFYDNLSAPTRMSLLNILSEIGRPVNV